MKKAIVTGANGFIGSNVVEDLLAHNVEVFAVCKSNSSRLIGMKGNLHIIRDDLSNAARITEQLHAAEGADAFYHMAWDGVTPEKKNDYALQIHNIDIGMTALSTCHDLCPGAVFINSGTVAEYVRCDGLINAYAPPSPADIYGAVKVASRLIIGAAAEQMNQKYVSTVISSTYGESRLTNNIISYTITSLLNNTIPKYGNLQQMWDFIYVKDTAHALYLIGEKGIAGSIYTIGSGTNRRLIDYITEIRALIDPDAEISIGAYGQKYKDVHSSCVDQIQLQRDTGFLPRYTFAEGIKRTISWFLTNQNTEG